MAKPMIAEALWADDLNKPWFGHCLWRCHPANFSWSSRNQRCDASDSDHNQPRHL